MAYFTFDTAWIVATMQNGKNEIIKEMIRARLHEMRWFADEEARCNYTNFETYCWAWQNACLGAGEDVRPPPPVNPYPYKPDRLAGQVYDRLAGDYLWHQHAGGHC